MHFDPQYNNKIIYTKHVSVTTATTIPLIMSLRFSSLDLNGDLNIHYIHYDIQVNDGGCVPTDFIDDIKSM